MTDHSGLTDALATDLDGSYERVVLAFQDRLYAFVLRMCGDARDAEEIVQDALVRAYRALVRYPPDRRRALALRAWLYRITLNLTRNRLRGRRRPMVPLEDGAGELPADPSARPAAMLERAEGSRRLARLVGALPDRYRAAVVLRHVEGLGYAEIAGVLGQPEGTVKANVHRGLALLRRALGEEDRR